MEAEVAIANWQERYNRRQPHSSQNDITPEMAYYPKHTNRNGN